MYSLVSAIAKPINGKGRWVEVDISNLKMAALYSSYDRILATLSNNYLDHNVCLDLANIRPQYGALDMTFTQVLVDVAASPLPTSDTLPKIELRYAEYNDAFKAGYSVQPVSPTASVGSDVPAGDLTWLNLTKDLVDYDLFGKSCLVTVNGFIHPSTTSREGVFVKKGMESRNKSNEASIGICSFRKLGTIRQIPITPAMLFKQDASEKYKDRMYLDLGEDVSGKTVMLVFGGYLHILDRKTVRRLGESTFSINTGNMQLLDRYYESRKYLDFSTLALNGSDANNSIIALDQFYSDQVMAAYATLPYSFFVVLDNDEIFVERNDIDRTKMPGMYISYTYPFYPLVGELGRMSNYWATEEDGQYSICTTDAYRPQMAYWNSDYNKLSTATAQLNPNNAVVNGLLSFLMIGSDVNLDNAVF